MPLNQENATDEAAFAYIADCQVREPLISSVTLEMESIYEVEALMELASESMETARTDFAEAIRTQRSSDALGHALQIKNMKALQEKLQKIVSSYRNR